MRGYFYMLATNQNEKMVTHISQIISSIANPFRLCLSYNVSLAPLRRHCKHFFKIFQKICGVACVDGKVFLGVLFPCLANLRVIIYENRAANFCGGMFASPILYYMKLTNARQIVFNPCPFCFARLFVVLFSTMLSRPWNNANNIPNSNELVKDRIKFIHVNKRHSINIGRNVASVQLVFPIGHIVQVCNRSVHVKVNRLGHF